MAQARVLKSQPKILIVDDDPMFRAVLRKSLEQCGAEVTEAESISAAREPLEKLKPQIIFTELQLPGEKSGVDLLKELRPLFPELKFVLMSAYPELMNAVGAAELGAHGFLAKPIRSIDIQELFFELLDPTSEENYGAVSFVERENDYCQINIDDFISGKILQYSIYVRMGHARQYRFIKIAYAGEDISIDRVRSYKEKGLTHLFIRTEDFRSYVGMLEKVTATTNEMKVPREKMARVMNHTMSLVNQELMKLPLTTEVFEHANAVLQSTVSLASSDAGCVGLLDSLMQYSQEVYQHSVFVSILGVLIAREMDWGSPPILLRVSTAGLFHDIGKKQLPLELLRKRRNEMNAEEVVLYERHPLRGLEFLTESTRYPVEIAQAVLHHHERKNGSGFPHRLPGPKIIPLAHLVAAADDFAHCFELSHQGSKKERAKEALALFLQTKAELLSLPAVEALKKVFAA